MKAVVGISSEQDIESISAFLQSATQLTDVMAVGVVPRPNHLSSVVNYPRRLWQRNIEKLQEIEKFHAAELLDDFQDRLGQLEINIQKSVIVGDPAQDLIRTARQQSADLILVARRRNDRNEKNAAGSIGGTASRVARYAECSVLLLNPRQAAPKTVLFATDGSQKSAKAGNVLRELGLRGNPNLLICTVASTFNPAYVKTGSYAYAEYQRIVSEVFDQEESAAKELLAKVLANFRGSAFRGKTMFYTGDVVDTLLQVIKENNVELLTIGSTGVSDLEQFLLGSTTLKLLDRARCSILIGR